jgi:hypothetical protein
MLSFVKYLDASLYRITVITLQENKAPDEEEIFGARVLRVANNSFLQVFHTRAGESKLLHNLKVLWNVLLGFVKPFEYQSWRRSAVKQLYWIHRINKIDLIISSYAPAEAHLAALDFCESKPEIKWIADMRDEMSLNPHLSPVLRKKMTLIEKRINARAQAVVTVSRPILEDFRRLMPLVKHFEEVRNGFDHTVAPVNNFNERFTIKYAGTFYGKAKPDTFFSALRNFVARTHAYVQLEFIGTHRNFSIPGEFEDSCRFLPKTSQQGVIELIARSDANLLIIPALERKGVFSGKVFDYISVMKPVIAVVDSSDVAAALIHEYNAGFVADFNDIDGIEKAIEGAYRLWEGKRSLHTDSEKVSRLHRRHQVAKLGVLINKILQE